MQARMCLAAMRERYHLSKRHGTRTASSAFAFLLLCAAVSLGGCNQGTGGTTRSTTVSSEQTQPRESRPSRSEVACHLHSCAPPRYCNREKGICELLPCNESRDCPYGYKCDFAYNVCK